MNTLFRVHILEKQSGPSSGPKETVNVVKKNPEWDMAELSTEVLGTLSNRDFLRVSRDSRLEHITKPIQKAWELKEGGSMTINFTFNGKFNTDLYRMTTAGQVMPEWVQMIEAYWTTWERSGLTGEFFNTQGNRLIIRQDTTLTIKKSLNWTELTMKNEEITKNLSPFAWNEHEDLIREWLKRGIPPDITLALFASWIPTSTDPNGRKVMIEEKLTEFERTKDDFYDDYQQNGHSWSTIKREFLAYYINATKNDISQTEIEKLGITAEVIKNFNRKERAKVYAWFKKMEELTPKEKEELGNIPTDILKGWQTESFGKQFVPGSKECQQLFTCAAIFSWLPPEWGTNESLHKILWNESNGVVGIANYTLRNAGISGEWLKTKATKLWLEWKNIAWEIGVKSTAVWLGQLTLSNEHYMPNGRSSIGIPLEEAIAMLRYIEDRYGSPTVAWSVYGATGHYVHANNGKSMHKSFAEWY